MNVRKRSGKVVPFDADFIRRAVALASAASGESGDEAVEKVTAHTVEKIGRASCRERV